MSIIQELIDEGVLVLYHDYRAGHVLDLSGNGNHGTGTDLNWTGDGLRFPKTTSKIVISNSASLQVTELTAIWYGFMSDQMKLYQRLFHKADAGGTHFVIYTGNNTVVVYDGTNYRSLSVTLAGAKYLAANIRHAQIPRIYKDGQFAGYCNAESSITVDDANLTIGNTHSTGNQLNNSTGAMLLVNRELTHTEHARLYAELDSIQYPTKSFTRVEGNYGLELLSDGDMEAAGTTAWTAGNSATLSKETDSVLAGSQVLKIARNSSNNPSAFQAILTNGKTYRITGWARSDGNALPRIYVGWNAPQGWDGTTSTSWQYFDFIHTVSGVNLSLVLQSYTSTGTEYTEWDNVTVTEVVNNRIDWKSDWGAYADGVTYSAGNYLPGTPFYISSGTWRIVTDTINSETIKAAECVSTGIVYVPTRFFHTNSNILSHGTWEFWLNHDTSRWTNVAFVASTTSAIGAADQFGYGFLINSDEAVGIRILNGATVSQNNISATGYVSAATWLKCKVTRSPIGSISWYVNDTLVSTSGGGGTNPFTEANFNSNNYLLLSLGTGDKISLGSAMGDYSIKKMHGVN